MPLLFAILSMSLASSVYADRSELLPPSVIVLMASSHCDDMAGFSEQVEAPGELPFQFGVAADLPERESVAVWCHWRESTKRKPLLLLWAAKPDYRFPCGNSVSGEPLTAGTIAFREAVDVHEPFRLLDSPEIELSEPLSPTGPIFEFEYYGLTTFLACHNGQWVFINID